MLHCSHPADAPVAHQSYCLSTSAYPYEGDASSPALARGNITCLSNDALVNPLNLRPSSTAASQPPTAKCHDDAPNRQHRLDSGPTPVHLPANCSMAEVRLFGLPAGAFSSTQLLPPTAEAAATATGGRHPGGVAGGGKRKRVQQRGSGAPAGDADCSGVGSNCAPLLGGIPLHFLASIADAYVEGGWQTYSYGDDYWWAREEGRCCAVAAVTCHWHCTLCPASNTHMPP